MTDEISALFDLKDQVALVTGASRGLGKAMALALAKAGCHVALNALTADALQDTEREIHALGRKTLLIPGDVSDEARVKSMVESTQKTFGKIDILINNAGVWEGSYLVRLSKENWDKVLQVNLTGAFLVLRAVSKVMLKQKSGRILNTASISGFRAYSQSLVYAATKAALIQMTKVAALELGPAGIRINAIAPGFFETDMTKRYQEADAKEQMDAFVARIPLRRTGQPDDLSGLAVFLASKASDYITGQILTIDGGASLI